MTKAAIIGTGLVGRAWAIAFARAGHAVALWDDDPAAPGAARDYAATVLPDLAAHGLLTAGETPETVLARFTLHRDLGACLAGAGHVQENAPEDADLKRALLARVDPLAEGDAVLASSTSAILPSRFTADVAGRARCLVAHPLNPPYLIPAVELVPAPWTSAGAMERTRAFLVSVGMRPIMMRRELDGFIMNRLQAAVLDEAVRLVADGFAGADDIDIGLRHGLGLRWSFIGPFEVMDLNAPGGVGDYVARYGATFDRLAIGAAPRPDWHGEAMAGVVAARRARLPIEGLPERARWRDKRLMALAAHKRREQDESGD